MKPEIQNAYKAWVEKNGQKPTSFEALAAEMGRPEAEIAAEYPTLKAIEEALIQELFNKMEMILTSSPEFSAYSFREQLLAVFFTWTEILQENWGWLAILSGRNAGWMAKIETNFTTLLQQILANGKASREVADRLLLSDWNDGILWWQLQQVTDFWMSDTSENHEQTDALIEKSVNFWVDLIQPNFADSAFDLARWLWNRFSA